MPARKSHHYVPQFYMRLFSGKATDRVGVFVINERKFIAQAPIKGQACRDYFYGRDGRAEAAFGDIEDATAPILKAVARGELPPPLSEPYERLMFYLGLQHARTPEAARQSGEIA